MLSAVSQLADLVLFILTVVVVGKSPTALKVSMMICVVSVVDFGFVALVAAQVQMNPIEWYQQQLTEVFELYNEAFAGQTQGYESYLPFVAGISPSIYVVQSSVYVFVGLCIRWIVDKVRHKSEWSPFSKVDLSIWWLMPLIAGVSCYTVSLFLQGEVRYMASLIAANLIVVSGIPLFVQGAAAGKGIMNRAGLGLTRQIVIGVLGLLSGLFFIVVTVLGLVDFWANFRKLDRSEAAAAEPGAE